MKVYLIWFDSGLDIMEAESIDELYFKYPKTVKAVIELDDHVMEQLKTIIVSKMM